MSEAIGKISDIVSMLYENVQVMEKQDKEYTNNDTELVHHFNRNKSVHKAALIPDDDISFASVVVPYCYLFLLSVFILWFSYYVSDIFCKF